MVRSLCFELNGQGVKSLVTDDLIQCSHQPLKAVYDTVQTCQLLRIDYNTFEIIQPRL